MAQGAGSGRNDGHPLSRSAAHRQHAGLSEAGGSLRELMDRMGHSATRAALIYQHRTSLRDKMIADEISRRVEVERSQSGTQRAREMTSLRDHRWVALGKCRA